MLTSLARVVTFLRMEALAQTASTTQPSGSVTRWRRADQDRLYVRTSFGAELGWWDLTTDEGHPHHPQFADQLARIVREWRETDPSSPRPVLRALPDAQSPSSASGSGPRRGAGLAPAVRTVLEPPADLLPNRAGELLLRLEAAEAAAEVQAARRLADDAPEPTWDTTAAGEQLVADELRKLAEQDPRWGFLNSIPVDATGGAIDHLVIGPGGVFTILTKHHRDASIWVSGDAILVDGQPMTYVRNARHEATRATAKLLIATGKRVSAFGMVVPVGAASMTIQESPADVVVVNRRRLVSFFASLPDLLDRATVMALFNAARESRTWLDPQS